MSVSDLFIRRPVFTIVVNLLLVIMGVNALTSLAIREFPKFEIPMVVISTILAGGSPEQIDRQITVPIEQAISSVQGIDRITSRSSEGQSHVEVRFKSEADASEGLSTISQNVQAALAEMPDDTKAPVVTKANPNANPVLYLSVRSSTHSPMSITDEVRRSIEPVLRAVPGVSDVSIIGERDFAVRINIDPDALVAQNTTASDVISAVQEQNIDLPAGQLTTPEAIVPLIARTALGHPGAFADLVVDWRNGYPLALGDVASIVVGPKERKTGVLINGSEAVAVGIITDVTANPLDVADAVVALIPELQASVSSGIEVALTFDTTVYIRASLEEVVVTFAIAVGLVMAVVMIFLKSLRASVITLVTVPLSLFGTLGVIELLGFSLNLFTLLAFILAIGLVVDDAIIDVENVQRHINEGKDPVAASFIGSREIGFAIIATTITLASVFVPVGFLPGTAGALFKEFAFTLAIAILLSGFVSRTLSPMMCSRVLRGLRDGEEVKEEGPGRLAFAYRAFLAGLMKQRWIVVVAAFVFIGLAGSMATTLSSEMAPVEDEGYLFFHFDGPNNASYDYMQTHAKAADEILRDIPEAVTGLTIVGYPLSYEATAFVVLKPWSERDRSAQEIGAEVIGKLSGLPGFAAVNIDPNPLSGAGESPVQFVITADARSYQQLYDAATDFLARAREIPGIENPRLDLELNAPTIEIDIDRAEAAELGIDLSTITNTIAAAYGEQEISDLYIEGNRYSVIVHSDAADRDRQDLLNRLTVRTQSGTLLPLSALIDVSVTPFATTLPRFTQHRAATLTAGLAPDGNLARVVAALETLAQETLPGGFSYDLNGPSRQLKESGSATTVVFGLAFVFVFFVMAAQFESFRDPFIVLSVVPLALAAAAMTLTIGGGSLNLYSGVGMVTLIGLIAKNGIMITEFANQLRDEGQDRLEAILNGAMLRLRPIVMTATAMVIGSIPLVIATGPGSASRHELGLVIVGGLAIGSIMSLIVVPVAYATLSPRERKPLVAPPEDEASATRDHAA